MICFSGKVVEEYELDVSRPVSEYTDETDEDEDKDDDEDEDE
jgi:hypothetical protein